MKNLTWQNPEQLFVAQELINKVKSKCCGIKEDKADCCGCTACASICPKDAITMEPDTLGFKYPKVDLDKCIDCGLCEKVCAFNDNYDKSLNLKEPEIYAARHKDIHEIETSRSGAAFIAISDYISLIPQHFDLTLFISS